MTWRQVEDRDVAGALTPESPGRHPRDGPATRPLEASPAPGASSAMLSACAGEREPGAEALGETAGAPPRDPPRFAQGPGPDPK